MLQKKKEFNKTYLLVLSLQGLLKFQRDGPNESEADKNFETHFILAANTILNLSKESSDVYLLYLNFIYFLLRITQFLCILSS